MNNFFDDLECREVKSRENELMISLPELIKKTQKASGWSEILSGVNPNDINSREALSKLPITRKSKLNSIQKKNLPFGGLNTTSVKNLSRIFVSPGPIFDPEGKSEDWWRFARPMYALGVREGDLIHNCFSYHFTPAGFMAEGGAKKLNCPVIPAGIGQTELQVEVIENLKPIVYVGTPSFLKIIIEKAHQIGANISSLKFALVGAEALPPSLRKWFIDSGMERVLQTYGTADIGNIAYETMSNESVNPGMIIDENLIIEIVRPGTGDPLPTGEVGEVVITSFNKDYPLIRFATGDMSSILSGISPCGRTNVRIKGWLGRADQTTKVRGMFIHPSQVAQIIKQNPFIIKAKFIITGEMSQDKMTMYCEVSDTQKNNNQSEMIKKSIREITKLRSSVTLIKKGALPNDGIVIEDKRSYD